jgi:cytochrome c peroxidase
MYQSHFDYLRRWIFIVAIIGFASAGFSVKAATPDSEEAEPAEVAIGERLFLETRFSFSESINQHRADPVTETTRTTSGSLPGPFRGQSINCRSCHLVDEHGATSGAGNRTYSDFAARSPVTRRPDGNNTSPRNALQMVDVSIPRKHGLLFHYDGEFVSLEDLTRATLTGRNFGWLPHEKQKAIARVASIIRHDDGKGELAQEFGGAYATVFRGTDPSLSAEFRLPAKYRLNVQKATDQQILDRVAELIAVYMRDLTFERGSKGQFTASPYDHFLRKNGLPAQPETGESSLAYSQRLVALVDKLKAPKFVSAKDGAFQYHQQPFVFGQKELEGMKVFFRQSGKHAGNCVACHVAPAFSDFGFHNTGVTQKEYDTLHGNGAFAALDVPGLRQRNQNYDQYLPATARHVNASGRFRSPASKRKAGYTDLGMWNVLGNPDMPKPQERLTAFMCAQWVKKHGQEKTNCTQESLLPKTIARFKTPLLRDLGHSNPYMHNGAFDSVESVLAFYVEMAQLASRGQMRNPAREYRNMMLESSDIPALAAFLKSLNEDYD